MSEIPIDQSQYPIIERVRPAFTAIEPFAIVRLTRFRPPAFLRIRSLLAGFGIDPIPIVFRE